MWRLRAKPNSDEAGDGLEFPSSFLDCSRRMFEEQDGCDVVFVVKGPGDATETKIGAHRYVLCSRSPFFHRTLQWGSKAAPDKKQKENDFTAEIFREILRFDCLCLMLTMGARMHGEEGALSPCLKKPKDR